MALKEHKLIFSNKTKFEISNDAKKGVIINELEFNYWLLKLLIDTKHEYLNNYKKSKKSGKFVFLNTLDETQREYANKIINNSKIYKIKNIYSFDIEKYIEHVLNYEKLIVYNKNSIISNIKYNGYYDNSLSRKEVNDVLENVNRYCLKAPTLWEKGIFNYYKDYFDYSSIFANKRNVTVERLINPIDIFYSNCYEFFTKILIKT